MAFAQTPYLPRPQGFELGMVDLREDEVELLRSMYSEEELLFPEYPEELFKFQLQLCEESVMQLNVELLEGYPEVTAVVSLHCESIRREDHDRMMKDIQVELAKMEPKEMQVLPLIEWVKEHGPQYFTKTETDKPKEATRVPKGFMREWCSFVSLYKDSYISGPNRFDVMTSLAKERGLNITGMGISGKPGGLVAEGEENDIVEFMNLMRTEFFETLNPRGRKLTTRLQERWPLDLENDRYEAAEVLARRRKDVYRKAEREGQGKFKPGELERLEKMEQEDTKRYDTWRAVSCRDMLPEEVQKLLAAGPPGKCIEPGVYFKCGCEEPPSQAEIHEQRLFADFTIFQGKEGFEASYQDAAKVFKDLGRMDGFDMMFSYRFS